MQSTYLQKLKNGLSDKIRFSRSHAPLPVVTHYESKRVNIPPDFLSNPPAVSSITMDIIDFASNDLPEYSGAFGVILDNVLSQEECDKLLELAAESTESGEWKAAMVSFGIDTEYYAPKYRNSQRYAISKRPVVLNSHFRAGSFGMSVRW